MPSDTLVGLSRFWKLTRAGSWLWLPASRLIQNLKVCVHYLWVRACNFWHPRYHGDGPCARAVRKLQIYRISRVAWACFHFDKFLSDYDVISSANELYWYCVDVFIDAHRRAFNVNTRITVLWMCWIRSRRAKSALFKWAHDVRRVVKK
jgi:hypothetical protein